MTNEPLQPDEIARREFEVVRRGFDQHAVRGYLQQLSSQVGSFTIPDVLTWQRDPGGPGRDEMLFALKMLYEHGILRME